jgi:hypothetical protein
MTNSHSKPPVWFWVIAGLALVWNAIGVMAYLADVSQTAEQLAQQPQAVQDLYASRPVWVTAAFAVSVFAGVLGCLGLLLKKSWSSSLLWASLIAVLVQNVYTFGIAQMHKHIQSAIALPIMVVVIAIFLVWFARYSKSRNWLS